MELIGYYNERGYQIFDTKSNFEYFAGNSPYDSQIYLEPENPEALRLSVIKEYCEQTLAQLVKEHNAKSLGCFYDEEN